MPSTDPTLSCQCSSPETGEPWRLKALATLGLGRRTGLRCAEHAIRQSDGERRPTPVGYGWATFAAVLLLLAVMMSWALPYLFYGEEIAPVETTAALVIVAAVVVVPPWMVYRQRTLRAAETAFDNARRFTAVAEVGDEMVWEVASDGTVTYVSPSMHNYLGYEPDELTGRDVMSLLAERELSRARSLLEMSVAQAQGWSSERYVFLTKSGEERLLTSSGVLHVGPKNAIVGFTGTLRRPRVDDAEAKQLEALRQRVAGVIDSRAFHPVYQPIVDVASGQLIGAEALTRFTAEPQQAPDRWFNDASNAGLGTDLELAALASALSGAEELPPQLYLSVNLSPSAMASPALLPILAESRWPMPRLVIEITEHVSVQDYASLSDHIEGLRARGARLAVDDAGAGYASFRHILRLAPNYIKLDRTLIDGMDSDPAQRALVNAVGTFASEIGASVIAEGIETAEELKLCQQMGLRAAQGYYIARPAPLSPNWGLVMSGLTETGKVGRLPQ